MPLQSSPKRRRWRRRRSRRCCVTLALATVPDAAWMTPVAKAPANAVDPATALAAAVNQDRAAILQDNRGRAHVDRGKGRAGGNERLEGEGVAEDVGARHRLEVRKNAASNCNRRSELRDAGCNRNRACRRHAGRCRGRRNDRLPLFSIDSSGGCAASELVDAVSNGEREGRRLRLIHRTLVAVADRRSGRSDIDDAAVLERSNRKSDRRVR